MKTVRLLALIILIAGSAHLAFAAETPSVLSFQAWKTSRIDDAKAALEKSQKPQGEASKKASAVKTARVDQKLQVNVDIAQELTVNDYFVLYLSQLKQRENFVEVAKKLTPEEMADLMMAYQKHLAGSSEIEVIAPSTAALGASVGSR